jgi:hypothetical protein
MSANRKPFAECQFCPLKGNQDITCLAHASGHTRFCDWVTPNHPDFKPGATRAIRILSETSRAVHVSGPEDQGEFYTSEEPEDPSQDAGPPLAVTEAEENLASQVQARSFPPVSTQVVNFIRAVARFRGTASQDVRVERMAICSACDRFRDNRCLECGCTLTGYINKLASKAESCPLPEPKWGPVP